MSDVNELSQLSKDHRELRMAVNSLFPQIATVDGKIDKVMALLERASVRQDRAETEIAEMRRHYDKLREDDRERLNEEVRRLERQREEDAKTFRNDLKEVEEKAAKTAKWTYSVGGAIALIAFAAPILAKFIGG